MSWNIKIFYLLKIKLILFLSKNLILFISIYLILIQKKFFNIQLRKNIINHEFEEKYIYSFSKHLKNIINQTNLFFKYEFINYDFSIKYNLIKIEYDIFFYNESQILINPSDLVFNYELNIICDIQDIQSKISLYSLSYIKNNKNFKCIEYFRLNQKIKFGITIYKLVNGEIKLDTIYLFTNDFMKIHYLFKKDNRYNYIFINKEYLNLINSINNNKTKNSNLLKLSYIEAPNCYTKSEIAIINNKWYYRNIYNKYFCFCKGSLCVSKKINQNCKYRFFLKIIFDNRKLYNKTDYLLADNLNLRISEDYSYPIFIEMLKQSLPAHYMTSNEDIYNHFSVNNNQREYKFLIIYNWKFINGDFLEKYLELILKLKVVLAAFEYYSIDNLFYNIEYISYINLGHGVKFFKSYLYNDYHSCEKYNKILIPASYKLISIAQKYGCRDDNIIKLGLPRWDKFNLYEKNNHNISIFLMFTWRNLKPGKNISEYYLNNTLNLLTNRYLNELLKKKNITLFFSFHHELKKIKLLNLKQKFQILKNFKNIKEVNSSHIFECIAKSSLFISDFSSVVFDFIYQKKPFILFIPDWEDPILKDIYIEPYYDIINSLKNGSIAFVNKFFYLREAINKIIYYINNKFNIERKIVNFYNSFSLNSTNNTKIFIDYLKNLK